MKKSSDTSTSDSDTTPPSEPPSGLSDEGSLLDLKGRIAWAAARETLKEMAQDLTRVFKPQAWVERYPLPATATAAAAGFIISGRIFCDHPPAPEGETVEEKTGSPHAPDSPDRSLQIWAMAFSAGTHLLKEMLVPIVTDAWLNRKKPKETQPLS